MSKRFYSVRYKNGKLECECISHDKKIPELLILKQETIGDFNVYVVQYTLRDADITDKYLKMMGLLFFKEKTVNYSLDLVNINNTDDMEIHLVEYNTDTNNTNNTDTNNTNNTDTNNISNRTVIEKIEIYPGNDKIIYYMIELLSHESVAKIFD
jgi:hypothetical protein